MNKPFFGAQPDVPWQVRVSLVKEILAIRDELLLALTKGVAEAKADFGNSISGQMAPLLEASNGFARALGRISEQFSVLRDGGEALSGTMDQILAVQMSQQAEIEALRRRVDELEQSRS